MATSQGHIGWPARADAEVVEETAPRNKYSPPPDEAPEFVAGCGRPTAPEDDDQLRLQRDRAQRDPLHEPLIPAPSGLPIATLTSGEVAA
jgi:hypothetical protein